MPTRRQALVAIAVLGSGFLTAAFLDVTKRSKKSAHEDDDAYGFLRPRDRAAVAAIAPVMLANALPFLFIDVIASNPGRSVELSHRESARALREFVNHNVVRGVDIAAAGLTPSVQGELRTLFSLLDDSAILSGVITQTWWGVGILGKGWDDATPAEVARFLASWRHSPIAQLRGAYDALHQLIMAAWYANPLSWKNIGYPGPPNVG